MNASSDEIAVVEGLVEIELSFQGLEILFNAFSLGRSRAWLEDLLG